MKAPRNMRHLVFVPKGKHVQEVRLGDTPWATPKDAGVIGYAWETICVYFAPKPWHLWYRIKDVCWEVFIRGILTPSAELGFLAVPEGGSLTKHAKDIKRWHWNPWNHHPDNVWRRMKYWRAYYTKETP